jgi:hypothetical protein
MADAFYPKYKGRQAAGTAPVVWASDDIKAALVSTSYTYDAAHEFYSDLTGVLADSANLSGKSLTADGIYDADDISFTSVTGTPLAVVLYKDTGNGATSPLIAYIDSLTGLPGGALSGVTINVAWNNGTNKIGKL